MLLFISIFFFLIKRNNTIFMNFRRGTIRKSKTFQRFLSNQQKTWIIHGKIKQWWEFNVSALYSHNSCLSCYYSGVIWIWKCHKVKLRFGERAAFLKMYFHRFNGERKNVKFFVVEKKVMICECLCTYVIFTYISQKFACYIILVSGKYFFSEFCIND